MNVRLQVGDVVCGYAPRLYSILMNGWLKGGVPAGTEEERERSIIGRCWLTVIPYWGFYQLTRFPTRASPALKKLDIKSKQIIQYKNI